MKKTLSLILAILMCLSLLPLGALADEAPEVMDEEGIVQIEEPAVEEPAAEEPAVEEPAAEEPAVEESAAEEPIEEEPAAEEPPAEEAIAEEPVVEEPIAEEPAAEEPVEEEPAAEEPIAEEPAVEEPVAEEPAAEEPIAEEPVEEEPVEEEPAVEEPEELASEAPLAASASVSLNWPEDSRLYSDGMLEYTVMTGGTYDELVVVVGVRGEEDWEQVFQEGEEYSFDPSTGVITLWGDKILEANADHYDIYVALTQGDETLAEDFAGGEVREAREELDREWDRDMLPGWDGTVHSRYEMFVENSEYPNGEPMEYTVVDVQSSDPNVVYLEYCDNGQEPGTDGYDYWWWYQARDYGESTLTVDYVTPLGEGSYSFLVCVNADVFEVDLRTEDGYDVTLPGGTVTLQAGVRHQTDYPYDAEAESFSFDWQILEDPDHCVTSLTPDEGDPGRAAVTFRDFAEGEEGQCQVRIEVIVGCDNGENVFDCGRREITLRVRDSYAVIWPGTLDPMDVGDSREETFQLRFYPGTDGAEYDLAEDVEFRVEDVDQEWITATPVEGRPGTYTLQRMGTRDTNFRVIAQWGGDGRIERWYHLDNLDYSIDFGEFDDRLFSDSTLTLTAAYEAPAGAELRWTVGWPEFVDGEEVWDELDPSAYVIEGNSICLDGSGVQGCLASMDRGPWFQVRASLWRDGQLLSDRRESIQLRDAYADYRLWDVINDDELLPGWNLNVDAVGRGWAETSACPDGTDFQYRIVDVAIDGQEPWQDGMDVLRLEGQDDNGWHFRALSGGQAWLAVTYEYWEGDHRYSPGEGNRETEILNVRVERDVYRMDLEPAGQKYSALPGGSIDLTAAVRHESERGPVEGEDFLYVWQVESEDDCALLTADGGTATVTFRDDYSPEAFRDRDAYEVRVTVTAYQVENRQRVYRAEKSLDLWMRQDYWELEPAEIDRELDMGRSVTVTPALWRRYLAQDGSPAAEPVEGMSFRWEFNENDVAITDNGDGSWTITRLSRWNTDLRLFAEGGEGSIDQEFWLDQKDYNARYDMGNLWVYDDEDLTVTMNTEELGTLEGYTVETHLGAGMYLEEGYEIPLPAELYQLDGASVTLHGPALAAYYRENDLRGTGIHTRIWFGDELLAEGECWVEVRECCEQHDFKAYTLRRPTCDEPGEILRLCTNCGKEVYEETPAEGHKLMAIGATPATLDREGNIAFYLCGKCGRLFADAEGTRALQPEETVVPRLVSIAGASVTLKSASAVYTGAAVTPEVTAVKLNGAALQSGTDYTVSYKNNVNAGTATVTVTGKGAYGGAASAAFTITAKPIGSAAVTAAAQTWTGKALEPAPTVKDGSVTLQSGTDYTVSYKNNVSAGTATVTVTGKGNYSGTAAGTFKINPKSIAKAAVAVADKVYTGKAQKPAPSVKDGSVTLKSGTDYTVTYKNNTKVGKATVTVTGKGNYTGTVSKTFKINPKAAKVTKATSTAAKKATVKWGKVAGVTGYKIQYSTSKTFASGVKTVTVKGAAKVSKALTGLKSGKTYYVRICTYQTVSGTTYTSAWSAAKSVKVK